ncbi:hypothetical protein GXM_05550 [Nostoc sphaeroides CCNUC1]|uniref:Uncharacterized protein n=1 Tax=Nostoc sphaeroides CCNUC1 TaxID=2653204 RepID=A0A5P8W5R1_9NOSO|nr:hypothetical protein GXM_05550 [Nostoc sphaeroides CCNUC1]
MLNFVVCRFAILFSAENFQSVITLFTLIVANFENFVVTLLL